jgi:hypothetical protein
VAVFCSFICDNMNVNGHFPLLFMPNTVVSRMWRAGPFGWPPRQVFFRVLVLAHKTFEHGNISKVPQAQLFSLREVAAAAQ